MWAAKKPRIAARVAETLPAATARWNVVEPSIERSVAATSGLWSSSW